MDYETSANRVMGLAGEVGKTNDIDNNFRYHKPGEAVEQQHEKVRLFIGGIAREMERMLPRGREAQLVQTKLEEAMFWANAAIARNQK